ncbi:MAG: hypothetical protein O9286_03725 [Aquidulcibacter sp.]|uniref:hypothetical protein n=1 Tax=Aquidulcibacter sp. TaxID=2052990 RepID=UPI0022BF6EE9|nr:hypothetical protein [Aquidulcibacter sp.]
MVHPRLAPSAMLEMGRIANPSLAGKPVNPRDPKRVAVWIEDSDHQDHGPVEHRIHLTAGGCCKMVDRGQRSILSRRLGTVHTEIGPDEHWRIGRCLDSGLQPPQMLGAQLFKARMIGRAGDLQQQDRSALVGAADFLDADPV